MTRSNWFWPITLITSIIAVSAVVFGGLATPLRPFITLWFLLVCPGMALIRLLHIREGIAEWTLALALSLSLDTIVAGALLYAGRWSPEDALVVLIGITVTGILVQGLTAYRGVTWPVRQPSLRPARWTPWVAFGAVLLLAGLLGATMQRLVPLTLLAMSNNRADQNDRTASSTSRQQPGITETSTEIVPAGETALATASAPVSVTPSAPARTTPSPPPPLPNPTSTPTSTVSTPTAASTVFTQETFDTTTGPWPVRSSKTFSIGYVAGRYQLVLDGQRNIEVVRDIPVKNYRLRVDVAVNQGGAGILFLATEQQRAYRFIVTPDGAFTIQVENQSTSEVANLMDWKASSALQAVPGAVNRLRLERRGPTVQFFANDQLLTDFKIPEGQVTNRLGFVLTSRTAKGQATFDNLLGERLPE